MYLFRSLPFRLLGKMFRSKWVRIPLIVLGVLGIFLAIWFGFPMTGIEVLFSPWLRGGLIVGILSIIALVYGLRWRRRRKRAQALEDSLMDKPAGDGDVLAERMSKALDKLKKSGGKNYLYDLPWYVIIGPPGAGKTTALRYSGIEFPGQDAIPDQAQGFGGTRNCDWWFAEDAVLIDTAGRYTTQDSNAEADRNSWTAFLNLLKKGRPDQPINGVILAFSVEDMMRGTPEHIAAHAAIVRERLAEIHEVLRIDFPVYVLFTKADLISGFREYFSSFSQNRRNGVWGVTFQTRDRREATHERVPEEFDALLSRLSDEVVDRMSEEPDGIARIAIFGLPGQMAMLRSNLSEFLRRVFEPTRYASNAILRGFYFCSGTQEGTPIDQVLGMMASDPADHAEFQPAFMSGKGKSFFLRNLLTQVIFAEKDWVNYDRGAVRRMTVLRTLAMTVIAVCTLGAMGAFGYSFWQNASLVREADAHAAQYIDAARNELNASVISDPDPSPTLVHLQNLRTMPGGFGDDREPGFWERLGLSRQAALRTAALQAYSDALERMLRPRMMLHLENEIPQLIVDEDTEGTYRALKVYMLLAGEGKGDGDEAIKTYFEDVWLRQVPGATRATDRDELNAHLAAMLELDGDQTPRIATDENIKLRARESIVNLPLADQAYAAIKEKSALSGVPDFNLVERVSGSVMQVFQTIDGTPLEDLGVPGLYTFEGYWGFFVDQMAVAETELREDSWVLGESGDRVGYDQQLANLENDLFRKYRSEFKQAWDKVFDKMRLAPMSVDPPEYRLLGLASSPVASPLLELAEAVDEETRMTRIYDEIAGISAEDAATMVATGDLSGDMGNAVFGRIYSRQGVFGRVFMDSLRSRSKNQSRAGAGGLAEDIDRRRAERLTSDFARWHMILQGAQGSRPIDLVLQQLASVQENRTNAFHVSTPADETMLNQTLTALTRNNSAMPDVIGRMLTGLEKEFRAAAEDATMADLNAALNDEIAVFCRTEVKPLFPFSRSSRHISPSLFGQFFGPGGRMDQFYSTHLRGHVVPTASGLQPDPDSNIGQRLSPTTLREFDRAQKIQRAFFANGGAEPQVNMTVKHLTSSPTVAFATLTVHGSSPPISTQPDSTPAGAAWPGSASGVSIDLIPAELGRQNTYSIAEGRWDIVSFLRSGKPRIKGSTVDVTYGVGGRSISYRFIFDGATVPFLMPELLDFNCPTALE